MRWFIETTDGEIVQVRDIERVSYDNETGQVGLTFASGSKATCELEEWMTAKAAYSYVPAAPGVRIIIAPPYFSQIEIGPAVIAWRVGGAYPVGISLDCAAEISANADDIAYLFPDGHVENQDGCFSTLDSYTDDFNERRERWKAKRAK
jgi:hypothetical protein